MEFTKMGNKTKATYRSGKMISIADVHVVTGIPFEEMEYAGTASVIENAVIINRPNVVVVKSKKNKWAFNYS